MEDIVVYEVVEKLSPKERLALSSLNKTLYKRNQNEINMLRPIEPSEIKGRRCIIKENGIAYTINEDGSIEYCFTIHKKRWMLKDKYFLITRRENEYFPKFDYIDIVDMPNDWMYSMNKIKLNIIYDMLPHFTVDIVTLVKIFIERDILPTIDVKEYILEKLYSMTYYELHQVYIIITNYTGIGYAPTAKDEYRKVILEELEKTGYVWMSIKLYSSHNRR